MRAVAEGGGGAGVLAFFVSSHPGPPFKLRVQSQGHFSVTLHEIHAVDGTLPFSGGDSLAPYIKHNVPYFLSTMFALSQLAVIAFNL